MSYPSIGDHGIIGDLHSIALVGTNGDIDWCCLPRFDSPSVFGSLLDDRKGGSFGLCAVDAGNLKQIYLPNTNILVTRYMNDNGMAETIDFMAIGRESGGETDQDCRQLVRIARTIRGKAKFRMRCHPAFDYARAPTSMHVDEERRAVLLSGGGQAFVLKSQVPLQVEEGGVWAEFVLPAGQEAVFVLRYGGQGDERRLLEGPAPDAAELLNETTRFWRAWAGRSQYHGRWREMVTRSALLLKLLTYQPSGAIVAAPTTSLPERIGGVRNWDYRYTWVRDAAFTVYSLMRLGYTEEAAAFGEFMQARVQELEAGHGPQPLYGIDGRDEAPEVELGHLDGYRGSRPVRIGNAAYQHVQMDACGELMDSLYLYDKYGTPVAYDMWRGIEELLDWVAGAWEQKDRSIWEIRGEPRDFTYSKMQCWVALDRGLRLARRRSLPVTGKTWEYQRDRIYQEIMQRGWNDKLRSFTQCFDAKAVDASTLLLPLMRFVSATDPRMVETIREIRSQLAEDSLVLRYEVDKAAEDGLPGHEGFFTACSFWLVEAMAGAGQIEEAQLLFEKMLSFANHLGLFAEEIGTDGQLLGNFPQALTHLALISAAYRLDMVLEGGTYGRK